MKTVWNTIQMAITAFGGFLGWFLGGFDGFLYTLVAFVVIDYITGIMCAINDHNLSSAVGFRGICRKVLILMLVGIDDEPTYTRSMIVNQQEMIQTLLMAAQSLPLRS